MGREPNLTFPKQDCLLTSTVGAHAFLGQLTQLTRLSTDCFSILFSSILQNLQKIFIALIWSVHFMNSPEDSRIDPFQKPFRRRFIDFATVRFHLIFDMWVFWPATVAVAWRKGGKGDTERERPGTEFLRVIGCRAHGKTLVRNWDGLRASMYLDLSRKSLMQDGSRYPGKLPHRRCNFYGGIDRKGPGRLPSGV